MQTNFPEQLKETGKRYIDATRVVDFYPARARQPGYRKGHGHPMIAETSHLGAAQTFRTIDRHPVIPLVDFNSKPTKPFGHRRYAVGLFVPKLFHVGEGRDPVGQSGGD